MPVVSRQCLRMLIHSRRDAAMTGSDSHSTSAAPTPATWILRTRRRSSKSQQTFNELIRKLFTETVQLRTKKKIIHGREDDNGISIINLETSCFITAIVFSSLMLARGKSGEEGTKYLPYLYLLKINHNWKENEMHQILIRYIKVILNK